MKAEKKLKTEAESSKVIETPMGQGGEEGAMFQVWRAGSCFSSISLYPPFLYLLALEQSIPIARVAAGVL